MSNELNDRIMPQPTSESATLESRQVSRQQPHQPTHQNSHAAQVDRSDVSARSDVSFRRVVWAVDAFSERKTYERLHEQREVIDSLRSLPSPEGNSDLGSTDAAVEVIPVFVLDDIQAEKAAYHEDARDSLNELMESLRGESFAGLTRPVMLDDVKPPFFSERKSAHALVEYAKEVDADLIVCFVSESPGIAAWFKGSFSEEVAKEGEIPVLLVGAHRHMSHGTRKIALPVDFNSPNDRPLRHALDIAARLDAHLTLLDLKETGSKKIMKKVFGSADSEERWSHWCQLVKNSEIKHEFVSLEYEGKASSATARFVRDSDIDLVIVSSDMIGGETLDLARQSTASVLVMRYEKPSVATDEALFTSRNEAGVDSGVESNDRH